ncbi:GntR family transcriptional regulator/MocR family aminotransferase [Arthrobacter globiformis]|uniref:MocR-like pyridoxine biosynthesis transcription factor PdxR n=1 Tax=Arthrobacter globiformis TaxID=1665 RepID=UPI00278823F8|nr:PLP-dependent aminotransferase family protein [Arthrobacter globiformis]MDQ1060434.1 GntR family transcriptional regulator/MocR family aminotransferase [Arthrobacter globiformis]
MPRTMIEVDRGSNEPLYRQVRRVIEHSIATGIFDPRRRLPSSRELAAELSVARNTINLAYQELLNEGLVLSHERRGIFVNPEMLAAVAAEEAVSEPVIDWPSRMRRYADEGVPDVEKRADWYTYPYPFIAGQIDVHSFPATAWIRSLREALYQPHAFASLQDSVGADDPLLVEMIRREILTARGIEAGQDEILITVGSQQGLDLLGRTLLGPHHRVGIENPGYLDARHIFLRTGAQVYGINVDQDGLCLPETLSGTALVYVTPSHQHPTNVTLSMERRRRLLKIAAASGTIVIEDDYDSEFRYEGSPSPALKALDSTGDVLYLGTFSKFLSPGLRLGFLVGPAELIKELRRVRRYQVRHPPGHTQRALALMIESGDYHRALRYHRRQMKTRWEMLSQLAVECLPWDQAPYPPGGVSLWMKGPPNLDAVELVSHAEEQGVLIERGDIYYLQSSPPRNCFRIGFGAIPTRSIAEGMVRMGDVAKELLAER